MFRFLSIRKLPEEDNDEEFSGEHAGSSAAGRMVVPPIDAMPFVTDSKSLAYELHWMLESSLVENCSVVMDDEDNRMSVGTPLSVCCFEGDDDAAPSSLTGVRTSPTRMLLLVIVGFCLLVSLVGRLSSRTLLAHHIDGAAKFFFRILPTKVLEVCLLGGKSSFTTPILVFLPSGKGKMRRPAGGGEMFVDGDELTSRIVDYLASQSRRDGKGKQQFSLRR